MGENIKISLFGKNDPDIESIGELFCYTFIGKNYNFQDYNDAVENIKRHICYEGFKGVKAKGENEKLLGFAYGYSSIPKQFYRQKLAAQLTEAQSKEWLDNCFEFVELAINPSYKRQGIGGLLHDTLFENIDHNNSVLTTGINNIPAIKLYNSKGWALIKENVPVITDDDLQVIMGKRIK